jgi:hypothetical protein
MALAALENAKAHLEATTHQFEGHRVEAIRAIDEDTRQFAICMRDED